MKPACKSCWLGLSLTACAGLAWLMSGCTTPPAPSYDPEIKAQAEAAQAAFQRGEVARAEALYGKALARARRVDDRDEIARNAYNLALCRMMTGQLDEARNLLAQARLLTPECGAMAVRILLAESEAARLAGDGQSSEQSARQALAVGAGREERVQSWLLQGEALFMMGQFQTALECYQTALKLVSRETAPALRARLDRLGAELVQARLMSGSVAGYQLSRANWLKQAGQYAEMVTAFQAAALAWEGELNWAEAFDCRIRAAQSLQAAGDRQQALIEAGKALECAGKSGSEKNRTLAETFLKELK